MLKEICQLQLADLTNHDSLNHESIQIRISRHTIAKPANDELNHQDWRFVQALPGVSLSHFDSVIVFFSERNDSTNFSQPFFFVGIPLHGDGEHSGGEGARLHGDLHDQRQPAHPAHLQAARLRHPLQHSGAHFNALIKLKLQKF